MGASYFVSQVISDQEKLKEIDEEINKSYSNLKKISEVKRRIRNATIEKSVWGNQNIVVKLLLIFGAISQAIVF